MLAALRGWWPPWSRAGASATGEDAAVHPGDFPDPFVLRVGSAYYAYATQTGACNVQVMSSSDGTRWDHLGDALPVLPSWAAPGHTWAPTVLPRHGRFVLYYTVREPRSGRQAISVATAQHPEGPFVDGGDSPLVFQADRAGSIDPSPFVDGDGRAYLLWKSEDNALQRPSSLWGQALDDDGRGLAGTATELLSHDRAWERPLIEAPSMIRSEGRYHLFYSGGWWESPGYAIGYAIGPSVLGPFTKVTTARPWFRSGRAAAGPGGQELFTDHAGGLYLAYHAWNPGHVGYAAGGARTLRITPVELHRGHPRVRR